jgi:hypothetical protein
VTRAHVLHQIDVVASAVEHERANQKKKLQSGPSRRRLRVGALLVLHSKSVLYAASVWARRALN